MSNWHADLHIDDTADPATFTLDLTETPDPPTPPTPVQDWTPDWTVTETGPGTHVITGTLTAPDGTVYDVTGQTPGEPPPSTESWPYPDDIDVVLMADTILDRDARVNSLDLNGHRLIFDTTSSRLLQSRGNIVNTAMGSEIVIDATAVPELEFVIEFIEVDESAYVGGGTAVLDTDVGLWTGHHGVETIHGAPKTARTRCTIAPLAWTDVITVDDATGWREGDDLLIAPHTAPGAVAGFDHWETRDRTTIVAVVGNMVTLADPLAFDHPDFVDRHGTRYGCPVLNLTRNVKIRGTDTGFAHTVYLHSMVPQHVSHVEYSKLGPLQDHEGQSMLKAAVLGRWAQHLHHGGDGPDGSMFDGLVVKDVGTQAFVPHEVNGITYRNCVAFNYGMRGFWWDTKGFNDDHQPDHSNLITYEDCVATGSRRDTWSKSGQKYEDKSPTGFEATAGLGNMMRRCWSFGHDLRQGRGGAFLWSEGAGPPPGTQNDPNTDGWVFEDCIGHNSPVGWDNWLNNGAPIIDGFLLYHCDTAIFDGAYKNTFTFTNIEANCRRGVLSHASKRPSTQAHYQNLHLTVTNPFAFEAKHHNLTPDAENHLTGVELAGFTHSAFHFEGDTRHPHSYRITNPIIPAGTKLIWFEDDPARPIVPDSLIILERTGQPTLELRPVSFAGDTTGMVWVPEWNCWTLEV